LYLIAEGLIAIPFIIPILGSYTISNTVHVFVDKLRGKAIIEIEGVSSAVKGDIWKSPIYVKGKRVFAYRYPATKIGEVTLNANGTGNYCGDVKWRHV
jgi:hypothetical protein